jgi:hypothetical protein
MDAASPPVVITAPAAAAIAKGEEVYGPVDEEAAGAQGCPKAVDDEIVVCALRWKAPDPLVSVYGRTTAMEDIARKLTIKFGPVELLPAGPAGTVGLGLRIRF